MIVTSFLFWSVFSLMMISASRWLIVGCFLIYHSVKRNTRVLNSVEIRKSWLDLFLILGPIFFLNVDKVQ